MADFADNLSIYLHWPFCRSKCPYCDFFSQVKKDIDQEEIITGYLRQIEQYAALLPERKIVSVFFGGGTPSLISPQNISRILDKISQNWQLDDKIEISLEANPNTQTPTLFSNLRHAGINRLSLGVQSLDDKELKFLGRTHTAAEALAAIEEVLQNFDNHSIDLIYALPEQTPDKWQQQLEKITSFGLKHISLYQLTIEENTVFWHRGITPLEEEKAASLYQQTNSFLAAKNYNRYEVSNYARSGFQSVHNKVYWLGHDYIGIGKTAHGRFKNNGKIFAQTDPLQFEELTPEERAEELVIMGLRLTEGINKQNFKKICGLDFDSFINPDFLKEAVARHLLDNSSLTVKATDDGFLLLDYLISGLCC